MIRPALRPLAGPALGALLASLSVASFAFAGDTYPPGPNGCCPDTLTIVNLRDPAANPHPQPGDVVLGIAGIVTGFTPHQAPYGFYMQMPGGAPYSGIAVFTGNVDHGPQLAIGDAVVVYGKVQHFSGTGLESDDDVLAIGSLDGTTQVMLPVGSAPQGDVLVRVVSHGNPLPPFHVATFADLDPDALHPDTNPWSGMLVQLPGPLVVQGATSGTISAGLLSGGTFAVTSASCTSDCPEVLVDGGYLTDVDPPAPGTILGGVQGIFDQRAGAHRVQLRSPDDLLSGNAPHASDAFPIYDNDLSGASRRDSLMVKFDRKVEQASAEDVSNYALTSGGAIDGVHRLDAPDDDRVVLAIRNGLADGAPEGITVHGVKSLQDGTPMFTPNTLDFFNGVLAAETVDVPDAAQLAGNPCDDRSRFSGPGASAGGRASFAGTVTGVFGDLVALQGASPQRAGLWVQAPGAGLVAGHSYLFAGALQEFAGETQGTDLVYVRDLGAGLTLDPALQSIGTLSDDTCDETQLFLNGQDLEGMLVKVDRVVVTGSGPAGSSFYVAIPGAPVLASTTRPGTTAGPQTQILVAGSPGFAPIAGRILTVTGVLGRVSGELAIYPRSDADLHDYGPAPVFSLPLNVSKAATASRDPDIVRGMNGELFMGWDRVFHESVHSLSLDNTQNWSAALSIMHQGVQPSITVTPSNKFGVLSATVDELVFKQSTDGGHQMDPQVTIVDANPTQYPAITVGSGEHFHAAWERTNQGIWYSRSFSGGLGFDPPVPLAVNGDGTSNSMVRIAASTGDNVYAFWQYHLSGEPGVDKVLYRRSLDGGQTFSNARLVRDESNPLTSTVKLAFLGDAQVGPDGTVWVLGVEQGSNNVALVKSTNQGFTFALAGELPSLPMEGGTCAKSIAIGSDGSIHALVGVCGVALFYTRSTDGGQTWTAPVDVSTAQSSTVGEPRGAKIILDGTGTPVIVWYASADSSTEIYSTRLLGN